MLEKSIADYIQYLKMVKGASPHTVRNYGIDLAAFRAFLEEKHPALKINVICRKTLREFIAFLNGEQLKKKSILRRISSLRSFFKHAHKSGWVTQNPAEFLETPKAEKKIPCTLSYDQIEKLLALPDTGSYLGLRDRTMMELFYSSGLRVSELVGLDIGNIDRGSLLIKVRGKGKKERIVPITRTALQWIAHYVDAPERYMDTDEHSAVVDEDAVFLNKHGTRISVRSVDRSFVAYLKRSGLAGKVTPHTIRHTIATHWLENGMDLKSIQTLLGHANVTTTTIYTKVSTQLKRKVYNESHPRA